MIICWVTAYFVVDYKLQNPMQDELRKEFYLVEATTAVSPHHIRKHIKDDDYILVDLRSQEEYGEEHIIGAVNIPAYKDKDHSDYGAVEGITSSFRELAAANPHKDLIVYCYSIPCMTGRKVGKILAEKGIYVKHLGVGWNEWRYH
ncbi:MAG: rhodanese-like domain-containing protein [Candidatus Nanoarchaeia archaeon]